VVERLLGGGDDDQVAAGDGAFHRSCEPCSSKMLWLGQNLPTRCGRLQGKTARTSGFSRLTVHHRVDGARATTSFTLNGVERRPTCRRRGTPARQAAMSQVGDAIALSIREAHDGSLSAVEYALPRAATPGTGRDQFERGYWRGIKSP
jgi:hypothetical protein